MAQVDNDGLWVCPTCGKRFICYSKTWTYRKLIGRTYTFFCSYKCYQKEVNSGNKREYKHYN